MPVELQPPNAGISESGDGPVSVAVILAAGRSKRMGQPKQLLLFEGKLLLQHTIDEARASKLSEIVLVLGHEAELILSRIEVNGIRIVYNAEWDSGMASSLLTGIGAISNLGISFDNLIILLCDQPFLNTKLIDELILTQSNTAKPIVACAYEGRAGVPVAFHSSYLCHLMDLKGDEGARKIINEHQHDLALVPFVKGGIDVDTPQDYSSLLNNSL